VEGDNAGQRVGIVGKEPDTDIHRACGGAERDATLKSRYTDMPNGIINTPGEVVTCCYRYAVDTA
jgi:hypothetical protein